MQKEAAMQLSSSAFPDGGEIPRRFTCDGEDLSPPLAWTDVPPGARSLVLLCDDPDARNDVESLKDIDIDYVIPLHCTGELYEMAKAEMPSKLLRSYTGTRFVFGD
jgi:Phosphatidylethanolamine-binding protein